MAEPGASQILNHHATVGRRYSYERAVNELLAGTDIKINGSRPWDIRVHDERFFHRLVGRGTLGAGESYMDGWWDCEQLDEMLTRILHHDIEEHLRSTRAVLLAITARLINMQSRRRAFRVGKQHYDLGDDLYERMLDPRMIYTCGYWENMH
jgi:cyclopropane-fatty-acyl-phospholipid synthase